MLISVRFLKKKFNLEVFRANRSDYSDLLGTFVTVIWINMKDLFTMTRHERMGTIAILVIVALLLLGSFLLPRLRSGEADPQLIEDVSRFQATVDTVRSHQAPDAAPPKSVKKTSKSGKRKAGRSKPKPSHQPAPRKMDPVPQF